MTKLFERSSEAAKIGVWECNLDGEQLTWTDVVYDIFDLPRGSRLDRAETLRFYPPTSRVELERVRSRALQQGEGFTLEVPILTVKGNKKWIRITATVEREDGAPTRLFGLKQDITAERLLAEQTRYLAEYDLLTGLANRTMFRQLLDALAKAPRPSGTLMLLDLDGFKLINDRYGHAQGDVCLQQLARRLTSVCARAQLIARIGGDEFAVLLDQQVKHARCKRLAQEIIEAFRSPIHSGSESFVLGVSIGIAQCGTGPHDSDAASIFTDADLALYAAKSARKNTFGFFKQELRDKANHRLKKIATIEAALANSELTLFYQPKVRLADGGLVGFEALLRHRTAGGRMVGPGEFMSAMDDPALSRRIGRWVLNEAIGQAARWRNAGLDYGSLSINIGRAQLNQPDFAETLLREIASRNLPPESIEIEITEGVLLDDGENSSHEKLLSVQSQGVRIAVDDFGTGYASLVHLRNYPIDVIKIDRSFVRDVLTSASDAAIVECVISLAKRLGKMLVVEGVETADQLAYLRGIGCEFVQGNFFSQAVPADQASRLIQKDASARRVRLDHPAFTARFKADLVRPACACKSPPMPAVGEAARLEGAIPGRPDRGNMANSAGVNLPSAE
ncbi:MAG: EAL domain-containing protein [Beijerinckiaceae bacterium]|nr:EAL domain-containing protein [Beijerinckiaceae bacterium]